MKFTAAIIVALSAVASASPTGKVDTRNPGLGSDLSGAFESIKNSLCPSIKQCVAALAPNVVACAAAAAEIGENILADAGCVAAAVNNGANPVSHPVEMYIYPSPNVNQLSLLLAMDASKQTLVGTFQGGNSGRRCTCMWVRLGLGPCLLDSNKSEEFMVEDRSI